MRGFNFFDSLQRDLHYSLRQLRKNLGFASTAVFVLALGMCASLAIFAFVDAALIKPLPYRDPGRLLGVYERVRSFEYSPTCRTTISSTGRSSTGRFSH